MKKFLAIYILALFLISCEKDNSPGWVGTTRAICIEVLDNEGNNLINPEFEGNILSKGLTITIDGKKHYLRRWMPQSDDEFLEIYIRDYPFTAIYSEFYGKHILRICNGYTLWSKKRHYEEEVTLDWDDGTTTTFKVIFGVRDNKIYEDLFIDGERHIKDGELSWNPTFIKDYN